VLKNEIVQTLYYTLGAATFLVLSVRFLYGWFRDYDNATKFTRDMAKHHLPFIYTQLNQICKKLDIEEAQPPLINFTDEE